MSSEITAPTNQQNQTQTIIPRKAIYKTKGSTSDVVDKKELIPYHATALSQNLTVGENDSSKKITFQIAGDCFLDGINSFISLGIKTNKYTSYMSSDITSIVKRMTISLPSNSNQVLEDINNYNELQAMLHIISGSENGFDSGWHSGLNALSNYNKTSGSKSARRFLNLSDEGEFKTLTFQLNLSGILTSENYLPLMLLNGIRIDIYLAPASEAFHYDPVNEDSWDSVMDAVETKLAKDYSSLDAGEKKAIHDGLSSFTNKTNPPNDTDALTYTITAPTYHAMTIWTSTSYTQSLIRASESQQGILLHYDSFRFNQIVPDSSYCNFAFPDSLQHVKSVFMGTYYRKRSSETHFNYVCNSLRNFTFRIGSRIYHQVSNEPSTAMTNLLLSVGKLGLYNANALGASAYGRSKNVHAFDFQNCKEEGAKANSGINTTNGRHLRLELNWRSASSNVITSPTDNSVLTALDNGVDYKEAHLNCWLEFSKFLRINSAGILVVE